MFSSGNMGNLGQMAGGLLGNSGKPFEDAMDQYRDYENKGIGVQNPFMNMGKEAIPQYQQWLSGMKDPSGFINNLMGKYSESPWAKFQQEQAMRAAGNAASRGDMEAGGLGSTPMAQFLQQNARNISSQDMNQWLSNVLGINTQYGGGLNNQIGYGAHSADQMTGFYGDMARQMAEAAAGQRAGENQDKSNLWGGLLGTAGTVLGSMYGGPVGGALGGSLGSSLGNSFS